MYTDTIKIHKNNVGFRRMLFWCLFRPGFNIFVFVVQILRNVAFSDNRTPNRAKSAKSWFSFTKPNLPKFAKYWFSIESEILSQICEILVSKCWFSLQSQIFPNLRKVGFLYKAKFKSSQICEKLVFCTKPIFPIISKNVGFL